MANAVILSTRRGERGGNEAQAETEHTGEKRGCFLVKSSRGGLGANPGVMPDHLTRRLMCSRGSTLTEDA